MLYRVSLKDVKLSLNFNLLVILVKQGQVWVKKLVVYCYVWRGMKSSREFKIKIEFSWMAWPNKLGRNRKKDIWQATQSRKMVRTVLCLILKENSQKNFVKWQGHNVVTVGSDKSVSKTPPFEIAEHWSVKKEGKIFLESQQNIYHPEIEDRGG